MSVETTVALVNSAQMPFDEPEASDALKRAVTGGRLIASTPVYRGHSRARNCGYRYTVDEHLNPDQGAVPNALTHVRNI